MACFRLAAIVYVPFALSFFLVVLGSVSAFKNDRSDNLAAYWGQDSAGHQQRLSFYCQDDTIDVIPLAFLYIFRGKGGLPVLDFSNICSQGGRTFPGTDLADCSFLAPDIKTCQAKGKAVTLSLGGGTAKVGFSSDAEATSFAQMIWDLFLGGQSDIRPLGDAILDGVDLDIESGSAAHYAAFVNKIRSLSKGKSKPYYVTAAPQCPFPDKNIGAALNSAFFDAVYVQFYNNFCETSEPSEFNFDTWDKWAHKTSPNPNVKVYLGAPAAAKAAGEGYVDIDSLINIAKAAQKRYDSFGGVMLWDADEAYTNHRYDVAIKNALTGGSRSPDATPRPSLVSTPKPTPTVSSIPILALPSDFRDPRKTARVKRPTYSLGPDDLKNAPNKRRVTSRFFRF